MANWKDEYLAALEARDVIEKANIDLYEAYSRIADRNAELVRAQASPVMTGRERPISPPRPTLGRMGSRTVSSPPPTESHVTLRQDLAKAQQERSELQARLDATFKELGTLKGKLRTDGKRITQLSIGITQMTVRVRDRDEELKGKSKLLEDVQDELVTLNLQLNMAEEEVNKLRAENQELIDRWMKRMGQEAEDMNDESQFA